MASKNIDNKTLRQVVKSAKKELEVSGLIADSPESDYNQKIPLVNRIPRFPSRKTFTFSPKDKEFIKLLDSFVAGAGDTRPKMQGIYFDKNKKHIVATDAHRLVLFEVEHKFSGIYNVNYIPEVDGVKNIENKPEKIDDKYPDYELFIAKNNTINAKIDVKKCLAFIQYVEKSGFLNTITRQMVFLYKDIKNDNPYIVFNAGFMSDMLKFFLMLGITEIDAAFPETPNRGVMFYADTENYKLTTLLMPVLCTGEQCENGGYGDIDLGRWINANYDLVNNVVVSNDRTYIDYVDISGKKVEGELTQDEIFVIGKHLKRPFTLPILNNVIVVDKKLYMTDLENSLIIDNVNKPDGIYDLRGNSLFPSIYPEGVHQPTIDEYPKIANDLTYYTFIGSIDSLELKARINIASEFYSKDDFMKDLDGAHFFNYSDNTFIGATDGNKFYIDKIITGILDLKEDEHFILPKLMAGFDKLLIDGEVKIYKNNTHIIFITGKYTHVVKLESHHSSKVKNFYLSSVLSKRVEYFDCVTIKEKDLKDIFKFEKENKPSNKGEKIYFKIDFEKNVIKILSEKGVDLGFERPIAADNGSGMFETGIFITPYKDGDYTLVESLRLAYDIYDDEKLTICQLRNLKPESSIYIPAPKIEGLKVGELQKEKIRLQIADIEEISSIKSDGMLKEVLEEGANLEPTIQNLKDRLELIVEMLKESDANVKKNLLLRAQLLVEMVKEYEEDFDVADLIDLDFSEKKPESKSECKIGQQEVGYSKVVEGKQVKSLTTVVKAFDSAKKLKDYLESDAIIDMSMLPSSSMDTSKYSFKIPMWVKEKDDTTLYFFYNKEVDCPYEFHNIESKTINVPDNTTETIAVPKKGDKVFDNKKNKFGVIGRRYKPAKGSPLENEKFLMDIKYDDGTSAINMPFNERYTLISGTKSETEITG